MVKFAFVAVFAAVAGYGVYNNRQVNDMSDLMMENVEALATPEIWIAFCIDAPNIRCRGIDMEDIEGYRQY